MKKIPGVHRRQIAVFGGGFNPPHIAHVMGVVYAQTMGQFDRIYVMPCWLHAFSKEADPFNFGHRLFMCELAFGHLPNVLVSDAESRFSIRYTVDLIEKMKKGLHPNEDLNLIIGADNLRVIHKWHRWDDLTAMTNIFVIPRPETSDISSTTVRNALACGDIAKAKTMLPPMVMDYILENNLYGTGLPSATAE